jgi:recombination protein RecR
MNPIERLTTLFKGFPGIGPRQAERFVFHLLSQSDEYRNALAKDISDMKRDIKQCPSCMRFFSGSQTDCELCRNTLRDKSTLLIIAKDADLKSVERTKTYSGHYFVLGGLIPILDKEPEQKIRINQLVRKVEQNSELKEIVFALNLNPEGEYTREFVENALKSITKPRGIVMSELGRGLSTGSEIEYSDSETLKSALANRKKEA